MRIIEWNCQGAFRIKNERILSFKPDILVVPECESEAKLKFGELTPKPNDFFWYGDSLKKGIGVFSFSDYNFELLTPFNPRFRYIIPLKITGRNDSFLLFAIWARDNKENPEARYIGQVWLAINYYSALFSLPCILTGDFNSNKIWDSKERVGNHSDMVDFLNNKGIYSLYHTQESVKQGDENHPTYHMYRNLDKPYHIDYCFASDSVLQKGFKISIEKADNWIDLSDHIPLIIELKAKPKLDGLNESFCDFLVSKLNEFSIDMKNRFSDTINELIEAANKIDKLNSSIKHIGVRQRLIGKYEKLSEIDKLINELDQ